MKLEVPSRENGRSAEKALLHVAKQARQFNIRSTRQPRSRTGPRRFQIPVFHARQNASVSAAQPQRTEDDRTPA